MNFIEEARGYNYRRDKEEEEEEDEEEGQEQSDEEEEERIGGEEEEEEEVGAATATRPTISGTRNISSTSKQYMSNLASSSTSCSGSGSGDGSTSPHLLYKNFLPRLSQELVHPPPEPAPPFSGGPLNFTKHRIDLMDLSLGNATTNINDDDGGGRGEGSSSGIMAIEKEHMFDKVVTPSDVGKLNRLVIPKQHAEKYFPLDATSNEKGLLLNFEDRNGKPWRFRYSYWNSSQSYVMTKGWSRFVKEKKLDAGDIVSFQRGVGEEARHRLFIDWRRRPTTLVGVGPHHHPDFPLHHLDFQNQLNVNVRWGNRLLYSLPHLPPPPTSPHFHYSLPPAYNVQLQPAYAGHYGQFYARAGAAPCYVRPGLAAGGGTSTSPSPYHRHHHQHHHRSTAHAGEGGEGLLMGGISTGDDVSPMVIDSVPVVQGRTVGKRLRLFGVNMDCPIIPASGSSGSGGGGDDHHREEADLVGYRPTHGLVPPYHLASSSSSYSSPSNASYVNNQFPPGPGSSSSLQLRLPSGGGSGGSTSAQSHELPKKGKSTTSLSFDLDL